MKRIITLAILSVFLSGCWSYEVGNPQINNKVKIEEIVKGKTTKKEIEKYFGEGGWIIRNGEKVYIYTYTKGKAIFMIFTFSTHEVISQIQVIYDSKDRVKNYHYIIDEQDSYSWK